MTAERYEAISGRRGAVAVRAGENISLKEALGQWTVTELRALASANSVKSPSKLRKEPLIDAVASALLERDRMREVLLALEPADWGIFLRAAEVGTCQPKKTDSGYGLALQRLGYLYRVQKAGKETYAVPEEVRTVYRELIAEGFRAQKERADLIHAYAMAAVNLYGVIPQGDLIRLFNTQNGKKITEEELFSVLIRHISLGCGYALWEEYLVNDAFEANNYQDVPDLLKRIGDKQRYIPPKQEFLKYADPDYYEQVPEAALMRHYLLQDADLEPDLADEMLSELHFAIVLEAKPQQLLNILRDYEVPLPGGHMQIVLDILFGMSNTTRLWSNNGFTPNELFERYERQHLRKLPSKAVKIGRNDPCPCGSGKKYKRCCGR